MCCVSRRPAARDQFGHVLRMEGEVRRQRPLVARFRARSDGVRPAVPCPQRHRRCDQAVPRDDLRHDARGNRTGAAGRTWRYDSRNTLTGANAPRHGGDLWLYPEGGRAWNQRRHDFVTGTERDRVGQVPPRRDAQRTHRPRLGCWRCRGGGPQPHGRPDPPAAHPPGRCHRLAAPRRQARRGIIVHQADVTSVWINSSRQLIHGRTLLSAQTRS